MKCHIMCNGLFEINIYHVCTQDYYRSTDKDEIS